ncbi:MAG TPA: thiamine phosphate synthase, partial [Pyrinomonadaceae bacterium]|nr:thiamine phosphate synthase [Pyrinomonadaceae bacterium]
SARAAVPSHIPLVAIGGITAERARSVLEAGADSVAVIGALLRRGEPGEIARLTRSFLARL